MTNFKIILDPDAEIELLELFNDHSKKTVAKAVKKTLDYMKVNLKHPSLHTHKFDELQGPNGETIFESYAQNNTPGAYRIFWFYGPEKKEITILAITPHP